MSSSRERYIARRWELLELEAEVQRAALAATFARLEQRRALSWATGAGRTLLRVLAMPRVRWLLIAAVLRRLRRAPGDSRKTTDRVAAAARSRS